LLPDLIAFAPEPSNPVKPSGQARFVHAPSSGGAVRVEDMAGRYWSQRFDGARRLSF
jgi:cell wall-associated NlpC family hydrolase